MKGTFHLKGLFNFRTFAIFIVFTFLFIAYLAGPNLIQENASKNVIELRDGWKFRLGDSPLTLHGEPKWVMRGASDSAWKEFNFPLIRYGGGEKNDDVWFAVRLPEGRWENPAIYFERLGAIDCEIYLGQELVYKLKAPALEYKDFNHSGHRVLLPLGNDYAGKTLFIHTHSKFSKVGPRTSVLMGPHRELMHMRMKTDLSDLILGFFFLIFGVVMIPILFFLNRNERRSLLSLSFFIICLGIWLLGPYYVINDILPVAPIAGHFIFYLTIMLSIILLLYFFDQIFKLNFGEKFIFRIWQLLTLFVLLYMVLFTANVVTALDVSGIINIIFNAFCLLSGIIFLFVLVQVIQNAFRGDIDAKIFTGGFVVFLVITMLELIMTTFYASHYWKPMLAKWTMLIFIVSLVLILGRRFYDVHRKLVVYSNELEAKNKALNDAVQEVRKSRDEVEELNKTLEKRVIERTQQLENALETLKETQSQLVQSEKMAALGGLVAGVAHEINTPVGIGITAVSHLQRENTAIEEVFNSGKMKKSDFVNYLNTNTELTAIILANLKTASELIKSFKMVAVDQATEDTRDFKVKEYIQEILVSLSPNIKKTKHQIQVNCDADIEINGYAGAFAQIVTNLVMNSLIHAYDEGAEGSIRFDAQKVDDHVIIKYSDDGKGIPKDHLDKIYDPFFTTKRNQGGTGLGLNIIFNIITQKFKGTIKCESEVGKGTTFTIQLPINKE